MFGDVVGMLCVICFGGYGGDPGWIAAVSSNWWAESKSWPDQTRPRRFFGGPVCLLCFCRPVGSALDRRMHEDLVNPTGDPIDINSCCSSPTKMTMSSGATSLPVLQDVRGGYEAHRGPFVRPVPAPFLPKQYRC